MESCKYCKEPLNEGATFCKHCNNFQKNWKNWVPHIGGAIALLIFIASILGYIIKPLRDSYIDLTWKDQVEVVYFSSNTGVTVKNSGDGDVFLETVDYQLDDKYKIKYSGAFGVFVSAGKSKFTTYREKRDFIGKVITKEQKFEEDEVEPIFCSENDPALNIFSSSLKERMLTFSCEAKLNYFSLKRNERKSASIPCVAYLLEKAKATP